MSACSLMFLALKIKNHYFEILPLGEHILYFIFRFKNWLNMFDINFKDRILSFRIFILIFLN